MRFGLCTSPDRAATLKAQGWDYVEISASRDLADDENYAQLPRLADGGLPLLAANSLVRAHRITGPEADPAALDGYMATVIDRAVTVGVQTLVFGSAGARDVPDGFDRPTARRQVADFLRRAGALAAPRGITIAIEPLHEGESNLLNGIAEAAEMARTVDRPAVRCLIDSYHHWKASEPPADVAAALPLIAHVHVADLENLAAPGESGASDYRPLFAALKSGGYAGAISVECAPFDLAARGRAVLTFLRHEWEAA